MKRLDNESDLANFLSRQSNRDITIISAFASGTVELLSSLQKKNRVEIIVGTINSFTSPTFIKDAAAILKTTLWVDFRGEQSIHWKIYLISPNVVVIGSANFTDLGVRLHRDTCVVIRNKALFEDYVCQVGLLKKKSNVLNATSIEFNVAYKKYDELHRRSQAAIQSALATSQDKPTFEQWLNNGFTTIPLFIWNTPISDADKREAKRITLENISRQPIPVRSKTPDKRTYRDVLVDDSAGRRPPFASGTIVLSASDKGEGMGFLRLDIVYRHREKKRDYMIALIKTRYEEPFQLTRPIKLAIKEMILSNECDGYSLSVEALVRRISLQKPTRAH
jgi:hypothetical protein